MDKTGWAANWSGRLKILLTSDISQFTISLDTDLPLTTLTFYDGTLSGSGSSFSLQSPSYFSGKSAGQYLEYSFAIVYPGSQEPMFTSIKLDGQDVCNGGGSSQTTTAATPTCGEAGTFTVSSTTNQNAALYPPDAVFINGAENPVAQCQGASPRNYWLAPDGKNGAEAFITMDLGCNMDMTKLVLKNTRNCDKTRGTKGFSFWISKSGTSGSWTKVLEDELTRFNVLAKEYFPLTKTLRYGKVQIESFQDGTTGGGLHYFEILAAPSPPAPATVACPAVSSIVGGGEGEEVVAGEDWPACSRLCRSKTGCRAWQHEGSECKLFTGLTGVTPGAASVTSGDGTCAAATHTPLSLYTSCPMGGRIFSGLTSPSVIADVASWTACADLCRADTNCAAWHWKATSCTTNSGYTHTEVDDGATAGAFDCQETGWLTCTDASPTADLASNEVKDLTDIPAYLVHDRQCVESCRAENYHYSVQDRVEKKCTCVKGTNLTAGTDYRQDCASKQYSVQKT